MPRGKKKVPLPSPLTPEQIYLKIRGDVEENYRFIYCGGIKFNHLIDNKTTKESIYWKGLRIIDIGECPQIAPDFSDISDPFSTPAE